MLVVYGIAAPASHDIHIGGYGSRLALRLAGTTKGAYGMTATTASLPDIPLPATIRSRYVDNINGLRMHVLEAGFETKGRPCVLLLHGFPELAYQLAQGDACSLPRPAIT